MTPNRNRSSVDFHLKGALGLVSPVCDMGGSGRDDPEALDRILASPPDQLIIRGASERSPELEETVRRANERGIEVVLRTHAHAYRELERAEQLVAMGVRGVRLPGFSHRQDVHDKILGQKGSLVATLVGARSLERAGLRIELEIPLLSPRVQDLDKLFDLFLRATPGLSRVRAYLPSGDLPSALSPPPWDAGTDRLVELIARCKSHGVHFQVDHGDGIPLCVLSEHESLWPTYHFNPKKEARVVDQGTFCDPCRDCRVQPQCSGVVQAYASAHDGGGLRAYQSKPKGLYEQRTTPKPQWTEERKAAAANKDRLVLRPTINCNQDCPFCSANETSPSVHVDPAVMLRRIARAGRAGVKWLSFSGGEPTLSKHLVAYIRTARRVGIDEVELVTNGTLLNKKKVDELAAAGLNYAFLSLHAHSEAISQFQTRKVGDFDRTVNAVHLLLDAGVHVEVNHVINSRNFRYMKRYIQFIHDQFKGRVPVSFAFITPQYQALEVFDLVPKLSEVMPYLREAMHLAVELRQPFIIGSRQGIPPCFLGEFQAWSDFWVVTNEAASEDSYQKAQGEACKECRYADFCTGLWKPYIDHYGFGELSAVPGKRITRDDLHFGHPDPFKVFTFDDVHEELRREDLEIAFRERASEVFVPDEVSADRDYLMNRSRPLRVLLAGTGNRARILAREMQKAGELTIDAVSSPHAPDGDLGDFGHAPAYRDSLAALDEIRPEALVVATNTATHLAHVEAAVAAGVPVLLEKPLVQNEDEVARLVELSKSGGALIMPAHQVLYATGLDATRYDAAGGV